LPTAQNVVEAHEADVTDTPVAMVEWVPDHDPVYTVTFPDWSPATQKVEDTQLVAVIAVEVPTAPAELHTPDAPVTVKVDEFPELSPARQKVLVGHETDFTEVDESKFVDVHVAPL
jgi:hypothetical protein